MKLLISISAAKPTVNKGSEKAAPVEAEPETKAKPDKAAPAKAKPEKAAPAAEAPKKTKPKPKAAPAKDKATEPTTDGKKKPKAKPAPKVEAKPAPKKVEVLASPEELRLVARIGNPKLFKEKAGSLEYLQVALKRANRAFFADRLPHDLAITLSTSMADLTTERSLWNPKYSRVVLNSKIATLGEGPTLVALVQALCHAAVSLIDRSGDSGVGPGWAKWMTAVGLTPALYLKYEPTRKTLKSLPNEVLQMARKDKLHLMSYPEPRTPAQYFDLKDKVWVKGLIVDRHDPAGARWIFIDTPKYTGTWKVIPKAWLYEVPDSTYFTPEYIKTADQILRYLESKKVAKLQQAVQQAN